ncbi:MAG: aquaporin [Solirubrobacterales bacterium]|nr:aquaporin [Solirubrobacterales bacterium]
MSTTPVTEGRPPRVERVKSGAGSNEARTEGPTLDQKLTTEFLGTFVLAFTVGMATSKSGAGILAPLAIGSALMVMVFAGAHISGAHYNPAVSIAIMLRGNADRRQTLAYIATQLTSGAVAGLLVRGLVGPAHPALLAAGWKIFTLELLFTFVLAYVVLSVATVRATEGNSFFGLAIGFTLATGVFAVGNLSGGAFNPAVALGGSLGGSLLWSNLWIYLVADCLGGVAAAVVFRYLDQGSRAAAT